MGNYLLVISIGKKCWGKARIVLFGKMTIQQIGRVKDSIIRKIQGQSTYCFLAPAAINCDGDPRAYHPEDIGKDYLVNAGRSGNWWGIACDDNGKPYIQGAKDPAPGYYVSVTSIANPKYPESDPRRYADSSKVPYIVLPTKNSFGAKLGDFCMALDPRSGEYCGAVYAENGPSEKIGEISIYLADRLGINSNPRKGGNSDNFIYVVFAGSYESWPLTADVIKAKAHQLFTNWGGFTTLSGIYPDLVTAPKTQTREIKTMSSSEIELKNILAYWRGFPHQVAAVEFLQKKAFDKVSTEDLETFAQMWRPNLEKATAKTAEAEPADPVYQVRFRMKTASSNSLLSGKLEFILNGHTYNEITCTSSLPGRQYKGAWNKRGGLIPPTSMVEEKTGRGLSVKTKPINMPDVPGVAGNFYAIEPFDMATDGDRRGDWGVHNDANVPGSMGCIVAQTAQGWAAVQREFKKIENIGIRAIELIVEYS
jgi:hypothetical protein